ncbi:MAG: hypothetical protein EBU66_19930, partial [Bacteroidetes bacterium]|nr:hypothetical protein [Bacteroidota bacterium]
MITKIESLEVDKDEVFVRAIVENMVYLYSQTLYDPPEFGPALCEASFPLDEEQVLPDNEHELLQFLEDLDLNW